ncbi:MAG: hypothetical protein HQK96_07375 [Nitrospirae bacterium]|nr:hypothetical protein [Nitrospirota bacterium]
MWRLIEYASNDAFFNMAADEAVALMVESGDSPPALRFYGWAVPSVTIGAFQRLGLDCAITQRRLKRSETSPATANPMCFSAADVLT